MTPGRSGANGLILAALAAAFLIACFSAALIGIRAQAYADDELAALINDLLRCENAEQRGCPMYMMPGETTAFEAVRLLESHPWVLDVSMSREMAHEGTGFLFWRWNGTQPGLINARLVPAIWVEEGFVQQVRIPTRAPFARLWLQYSPSQLGDLLRFSDRGYRQITYLQSALEAHTTFGCPFGRAQIWSAATDLRFGRPTPYDRQHASGWPGWIACSPRRIG